MSTSQTADAVSGDPAAAATATGGCCGNPPRATPTIPDTTEAAVGPCCGTAADAIAERSCCGSAAKADAVTSQQGCCG
jgi:hypothetical protein